MKSDVDESCSIFCTKTYSLEEALPLMFECRMSMADYQTIPREKDCRPYPAYNFLVKARYGLQSHCKSDLESNGQNKTT